MLKEKLKDLGRRIIGEGAEVNFKNAASEHSRTHGVSIEEAKKAIFADRLRHAKMEMNLRGGVPRHSKEWRAFSGALNELFGKNELDLFRQDGSRIATPFPVNITNKEIRSAETHFKANFDNNAPRDMRVLDDFARNLKTADGLLGMITADPRFGASRDLQALLAASPDLRAYLGKALLSKDGMEMHERHFGRKVMHDKTMEGLGKAFKESSYMMLGRAPADYAKAIMHLRPNLPSFMKFTEETAKFFGREIYAGTKLAYHTGKAVATK